MRGYRRVPEPPAMITAWNSILLRPVHGTGFNVPGVDQAGEPWACESRDFSSFHPQNTPQKLSFVCCFLERLDASHSLACPCKTTVDMSTRNSNTSSRVSLALKQSSTGPSWKRVKRCASGRTAGCQLFLVRGVCLGPPVGTRGRGCAAAQEA